MPHKDRCWDPFVLYINDLNVDVRAKITKLLDDTKCRGIVDNVEGCQAAEIY